MDSRLKISRRDFLGGVALGAAAPGLAPLDALAALTMGDETPYPPALTGMRGNHPGAFEVAHAVAWGGKQYPDPRHYSDDEYDLVVVGGGISGLAAAHFFRQARGPAAKILILDNHDDFGGHAKRNEFTVDGKRLIGYGGSQSIDTPGSYSAAASGLLRDLGIDTERFYQYFDRDFFPQRDLHRGLYFSREAYGQHATVREFSTAATAEAAALNARLVARYPLEAAGREMLLSLLSTPQDHLPNLTRAQKIVFLRQHSYRDYLLQTVGAPESIYLLLRDNIRGWWGVGWDAISALEAARMGMPGTAGLALGEIDAGAPARDEPYIFHFPDGNAGVARALVRRLLPAAVPGDGMEDLVTALVDYGALDRPGAACRIRLNSTAVRVKHSSSQKQVDVTYVNAGNVYKIRARHCILACYNHVIPHICPELPQEQREAIGYATKVPLVYLSVAVRNWRPFAELGYRDLRILQPRMMHSIGLDFPVSMGGYQFSRNPDQPTVLHGSYIPCAPDQGLEARAQHRLGRQQIYQTSFSQFEENVIDTLSGALEPGGFDAERDIAAITVNRWPHGYSYEYNDYSDPLEYGRDNGPHLVGARQMGRISIANSDAAAYAFMDGAVDAAWRATQEQLQ